MAALFMAPCANAQEGLSALTEAEVARLAAENPAWSTATEARRLAAEARADAAGARPNIEVEVTREGGDGLAGGGTEDSARLRYPLDIGGVRAAQRRAGIARRDAELAALQSIAATRVALARALYVEAAAAADRASVRRGLAERLMQLSGLVRRRVELGDAAELELRRVEAEAETARLLAGRQEADAAAKWTELQGYLGLAGRSVSPPARLQLVPPRALEDYLALLPESPEARRQLAEARAAEVESEALRRRASTPQTAIVGGVRSVDEAGGRSTGVIVGAVLSLPFGGAAKAEARARAAEANALNAEQRLNQDARRNAVIAAWAAADRLSRTVSTPPPSVEAIIRPAEAAYQAGEVELGELLSAHRTAADAALARIDLEQEAALARVRLDELVGKTVP